MPRGRAKKPESFEDEIAALDKQIDELTEKLKVLKATRRASRKKMKTRTQTNGSRSAIPASALIKYWTW